MAGTAGLAVLAACGSEETTTTTAAAPAAAAPAAKAEAPAAKADAPAAAPAGDAAPARFDGAKVEFRFNGLNPAGQEAARKSITEFKALTGIDVTPDFSDWASSFQKITTGFAAGTAPDIWYGGGLWTPVLAAKGGTLFIDEYVKNWDQWSDFYPRGIEDVTYEGHIHGVPYRFNYRGNPVIRPSFFEAAGLEPTVPTTWEELNEAIPKLTKRDGDKFEQAGFNLEHSTQVYEDWLFQAGGNYFNEERTKPLNNSPEGKTALSQHVQSGLDQKARPPEGMDSGIPNLHAFCAGKVAIQQLWPGNVGNCETNAPDIFADVLVGKPFKGPKEQVLQIYVDKYQPYRLTKNPDATFETMKYFASPTVNHDINVVGDRSMPCRVGMESYELYQTSPWKEYVVNAKFGKGRQIVPQHFDVQPAMGRWVEKAALGDLTVEEALEGMDKEVTQIISS